MQAQIKPRDQERSDGAEDAAEAVEFVLFQVSECYVYLIPPRKTAASYRADEWNVNKWAWEGVLKVISKGEECAIRLEEKTTGELYARAFLRNEEPHPVETVIDSSRYFVLRIEEEIGGRRRHAFIGIGFRERTEAYDFQAALHDHMKYLNKKRTAEEMEQHYQHTSSVDYSLKEGETIVLQLKNQKSGRDPNSKLLEQNMSTLSLDEKGNGKEPVICLKPPPPPAATVSPASTIQKAALSFPTDFPDEKSEAATRGSSKQELKESDTQESRNTEESSCAQDNQSAEDAPDDDFGDFQTAG